MNLENDFASFWMEKNILFYVYKQDVEIDLLASIKIVSDRIKFQRGIAYPILCDVRGIRHMNKEARKYLASEGSLLSKAVALISNNPLSEMLSEMYVINGSPAVPTKIFLTVEEGIEYLETYK
ncbi:hypothetical protein NO995_11105 [Aestuariibaculum sp. M13]|uniref:DUF7793 family protein n=1 Tax=Aestuariibaculum sp. M13 TaxID=2967132 RepID=UPI002159DD23|nr:hypothetical protein [Aestuariibaculum sp. M13]MCR8668234.1 hypothetical protein [Aestuariibaculum sp. M13]